MDDKHLGEFAGADATVLTKRLRAASAVFGHAGPPHGDIAVLLMDAALAVEHLSVEARVQRGMAIASQSIAGQLSARLDLQEQRHSPGRVPPLGARLQSARRASLDGGWVETPGSPPSRSMAPIDQAVRSSEGRASDEEAEDHIDALVASLKKRFRQSGVPLPLARQQGTVYRLGSRKITLATKDGRLTVRSASGEHTDLLEYLSKRP
ncbi:hypothetical protein T492DRAFT_1067168 [Pavlovales sp. CCMP2436]|nr:hypothetical protein T492DRAFT_1067168 [Pavlovales sp. CCMP2436]|mmetsp:Transcript_16740/g.42763  ORF Transcript_16740/g.42763 Transcript_16740/m.42763 type:complete len:208 (-) Transcript_16740:193-816(-)